MKEIYNDLKTDPSGFVLLSEFVPSIIQEIRYYTTYNFIGDRIDGYEEPCALLTKEAARALKAASSELIVQGYRLKVFDAYRPACAVKHFILWGIEDQDIRMKPYFYPELEKHELFERGYISKRSSHSRGSALDLTLFDMKAGKEVDMGSPFDLFSEVSHPDYRGIKITDEQYAECFELAKKHDKSIEIHSSALNPHLPLNEKGFCPEYIRMLGVAKEVGCTFHLGSDVHRPVLEPNLRLREFAEYLGIGEDRLTDF